MAAPNYSAPYGSMMPEGETLKMRASCDACNSSKVRCSQAKPKCVRCERQGIPCIYGLSRRSHKTAPRIGESQTSAISFSTPSASNGSTARGETQLDSGYGSYSNDMAGDLDWMGTNMTPGMTPDLQMMSDPWASALETHSDDIFYSPPTAPGSSHAHKDSIDNGHGFGDSVDMPMFGMLDQLRAPSSSSVTEASMLDDMTMATSEVDRVVRAFGEECTCGSRSIHSGAQGLLAPGEEQSFDTQLARLKRNINSLQQALSCSCIFHDQTVILSISVFLGRMISDFEVIFLEYQHLASNANCAESPHEHQNMQALTSECSTFKNVQIDTEEAQALKLHLWLLQFQKLEKVLSGLDMAIRSLKHTQGKNFAHIMACESLQSWLLQRAKAARERFNVRT